MAVETLETGLSVNRTTKSKSKLPILESRKGGDVASKISTGGLLEVVAKACTEMKVGKDTGVPLPMYLTLATEYSS